VAVDSNSPEQGLRAAGWVLAHGETYCPACARARGLSFPAAAGSPPPEPDLGPALNGSEGTTPPGVADGAATAPATQATNSREVALLDKLEQRAKRYLLLGGLATAVGLLLFAGLSTNPVAVAVAAVTAVVVPLTQFWDDRTERRSKQAIGLFLAVMAFWLVVQPLSHGWGIADLGNTVRWVLLLLGSVYGWRGLSSLRYIPLARSSLSKPAYDVRLEIQILRGYGGIPYTQARLWPPDPAMLPAEGQVAHPLAQFSWQASEPQIVALDGVPAKVHGAPTNGAVVVVSSQEAVLVGRVKRSHFGESPSAPKPMSPLVAWLWKPRHLRVP